MYNLEELNKLLESGVITKEEYKTISKRLSISNNTYEETWQDVLDEFYNWCSDKYTVVTAKGYKTCLYKLVLWVTKESDNSEALQHNFKLYSFTDVNGLLNNMKEKGFNNQSINKVKYSINVLGKYLKTKGIKTPDIKPIKISIKNEVNNTTFAFRDDEVYSVASVGELRNKVCIMLCFEGCLKRIELMNLRISDFDFNKRQLFIYDKNNKIDRVCILSDSTIQLVKQYIDELYENIEVWNKSRITKGKQPRKDLGYIFQSIKMIVPSYSLLHTMVKDNAKIYYEKQGFSGEELDDKISKFSFENIRNSRKVYLLAHGFDVSEVMKSCGDKNYMSTHRFARLVPVLYPELVKTT